MQTGSIEDHNIRSENETNTTKQLYRLNRICIRRFLNTFVILYRHIYLHENSNEPPATISMYPFDCGIKLHHIIAASDDFGRIAMNWDLMPAAKLNYMHDFAGMYNCVSQVVYFHNPSYERLKQYRDLVSEISVGNCDAVQVIPCILQLFPQIELLYEEEIFDLTTPISMSDKYYWILAAKRVYLLTPELNLFYHKNCVMLLALYIDLTK